MILKQTKDKLTQPELLVILKQTKDKLTQSEFLVLLKQTKDENVNQFQTIANEAKLTGWQDFYERVAAEKSLKLFW